MRAEIRLVTLIGPPGMGKTRLSIEAARQSLSDFPDGVFFVRLALLEDPSMIASRTIQALGYVESGKLPAAQQLMRGIGDKQMLIVLDNCEHLIEEVADFASGLLSACSRLKILATSRESLRIPGEWLYALRPLEFPKKELSADLESVLQYSALKLFVERARAVRPGFVLDAENAQTVVKICTHLDGLPLAIELIAAQMRLYSPQSLLERLNDQFVLSAPGMRMDSSHHASLNHAIDWSYSSLMADEQKLFACLSVFSGGFGLPAVETIFSRLFPSQSVSALVTSLLDKSLLQRIPAETGEPRFGILVTIRQFALERLRSFKAESDARDWHMTYFLNLAEQGDEKLRGPDQLEWLERLELELDNFRAALVWCISSQQTESAVQMLTSLSWHWVLHDHSQEAINWFKSIRLLSGVTENSLRYARLLNHIGCNYWFMANFRSAQSILEESRSILTKPGIDGEQELGVTLLWLGLTVRALEGGITQPRLLLEKSLEINQKYEDEWNIAYSLLHLGYNAMQRNEDAEAFSLLNQGLDLLRQLGDLWGMGFAIVLLGNLSEKKEDYEKARSLFEQYLTIQETLYFKQGLTHALIVLGEFHKEQGEFHQAEQFFQKSLKISRDYDLIWPLSLSLYELGLLALARIDYSLAKQYFTNTYDYACTMYSEAQSVCDLLTALAAVAAGTDQPERAAKLYGATQAALGTTEYRIKPSDLAAFERHIQIAREQMGDSRFESLVMEGRAMTLEQAVKYALEGRDE